MSADILRPYGKSETSIERLSASTYTAWQFFAFLVLLKSYPDDDHKSDRNMLANNKTYCIHVPLLILLHKFKS